MPNIQEATTAKLWITRALTPYGNEYGLVAVLAQTQEEAIAKAKAELQGAPGNYVPHQQYAQALLDNLAAMREVTDGVVIDWDAASR
jgi:hypothetical protein